MVRCCSYLESKGGIKEPPLFPTARRRFLGAVVRVGRSLGLVPQPEEEGEAPSNVLGIGPVHSGGPGCDRVNCRGLGEGHAPPYLPG